MTAPVEVPVAAEVKPAEPLAVQSPEVPVVAVPVEEMPEPELVAKTEREQPTVQEKKVAEVAEAPDTERVVAAGLPAVPVVAPLEMSAPIPTAVDGVAPVAALSGRDVPVQRMDVLVEAATAVADTLLVSPSLLRGEGEVLVQLKPDVLEGSQIRIVVSGKVLDVSFQTPTPDLAQMLVARLPELQQHLAAAVPAYSFNVKVVAGRTKWTPLNS